MAQLNSLIVTGKSRFLNEISGVIETASKLGSSTVGGTTTPIYLNAGVPTALGYTIAKSVPSDAVFTDTNNAVTQTATSNNVAYEVLFSGTADNTTRTEGARKTDTLRFNPSIGALMEGFQTYATGNYSHAEGGNTTASATVAHAEGGYTYVSGKYSHGEGCKTSVGADSWYSHAEGYGTSTYANSSHTEGYKTVTYDNYAHAEGDRTTANGVSSHSEGSLTCANGSHSHAEGVGTYAYHYAHAEGYYNKAIGNASHAEGGNTTAKIQYSHAEGYKTSAAGAYSHAEGNSTTAYGNASHAEGSYTYAGSDHSHASGYDTKTNGSCQTVIGKWNDPVSTDVFEVGWGSSASARKNVFSVDQDGKTTTNLLYANFVACNVANNSTAGGLTLFGTDPMSYSIIFRTTGTGTGEVGKFGDLQGDWATAFTMAGGATRGWLFRLGSTNVASINAQGEAAFAKSVNIGANAANTSGCKMQYNSTNQTLDFVFK